MRVAAGGGLALGRIVPELEAAGVRHQDDLGSAQGEHPGDLGELIVVADDDADLARADVEDGDLAATLVIEHLVPGEVQLPLLADVALRADQDLRIEDDVAFLLAHAGAQDQAMAARDVFQPADARPVRDRFGQLPGVRRAVAVDDQLGEQDQLRPLRRGLAAPAIDGAEDPLGFAEKSVHAHRGHPHRSHVLRLQVGNRTIVSSLPPDHNQ